MALTDQAHWNQYWRDVRLPVSVSRGRSVRDDLLLDVLEAALDVQEGHRVLEVGGAPGGYLSHFATFDAKLALLDYSSVGCQVARQNMDLLGLAAEIVEADLFAPPPGLEADRVYSLGVVEHFEDLEGVLEAHLQLVSEGGRLVIGFPNFGGLYRVLLRWQRPAELADTVPSTMDLRTWPRQVAGLAPARMASARYVTGFTPEMLQVPGSRRLDRRIFAKASGAIAAFLDRRCLRWLRRVDSRWTSGYAVVTYEREPRRDS